MEDPKRRFIRFSQLINAIVNHDENHSFLNLVDSHADLFQGFKVIYSTNNVENQNIPVIAKNETLDDILVNFLYGKSHFFYTDKIFSDTIRHGLAEIPTEYSFSLDSNVAEKFRIWYSGGSLDSETERFERLVNYLKFSDMTDDKLVTILKQTGQWRQGLDISRIHRSYDYLFFIAENLKDTEDANNTRIEDTIAALQLFETLATKDRKVDLSNPVQNSTMPLSESTQIARQKLEMFRNNGDFQTIMIERRLHLYLIHLKAVLLFHEKSLSLQEKLRKLVEFCLEKLRKYTRSELYFAWKLFKFGTQFKFFNPAVNLSSNLDKRIKNIQGMSWDMFSVRYLDTMASNSSNAEFFVPSLVSFDNKYRELAHACQKRAIVMDTIGRNIQTLFRDEAEFSVDLEDCLTPNLRGSLTNVSEKMKRMKMTPDFAESESIAKTLEEQIKKVK